MIGLRSRRRGPMVQARHAMTDPFSSPAGAGTRATRRAFDLLARVASFDAPPPVFAARVHSVPAFHLWGALGLALALALALILVRALGLSAAVILTSAGTGVALLFVLTGASRVLLGEEVLVNYHHLVVVSAAAALVARAAGVPVVPHLTVFIVALMVFQGCGRLGCLSAGCCHGRPAECGIRYGARHVNAGFSPMLAGVPLVPVQALEAMGALLIAALGATTLLGGRSPLDVLLAVVPAYALVRFAAEFLRADVGRPRHAGLTQTQWISLVLLGGAALAAWTVPAGLRFALAGLAASSAIAAAAVALARRRHPEWALQSPEHVLELAGALALACGDADMRPPAPARELHVATTSLGISVSAGAADTGGRPTRHYTFTRGPEALTESAARRLATLALRLRHPGHEGTLVRGRRAGAYHLLVGGSSDRAAGSALHLVAYPTRTEVTWSLPFPPPRPPVPSFASAAAPSAPARTSAGPTTG